MHKGEPPASLHSVLPAREGRQGTGKVPARGLAACSPACTAALRERREM